MKKRVEKTLNKKKEKGMKRNAYSGTRIEYLHIRGHSLKPLRG